MHSAHDNQRYYRDFRKPFVFAVLIGSLTALAYNAQTAEAQDLPGIVESISGRSYRAIQAAVPHLERYNLNVADYRITVWETTHCVKAIQDGRTIFTTESRLFVMFHDPDVPLGQKGSPGKKRTFSVELVKDDFRVLGACFDR